MSNHPINELLSETMTKLKDTIDVNTIIGDPIVTHDGVTLIPISTVSFGFGTGGSDFSTKGTMEKCFGGGGGAGVTISPVAFVVVSEGFTKVVPINAPSDGALEKIIDLAPDVINKISNAFKKHKETQEDNYEDYIKE